MKCQHCETSNDDVKRTRQNTKYANDESNYATLCHKCQKDANEYWADMWAEYYAGCM